MGEGEDEEEMDGMQMMHEGEVQGDDGDGQEDDEDGEDDDKDMQVAMDGQGGEELVQDGDEHEDESPQAEGEDDDVDEEVAQAYANQPRMDGDADDDDQMMGEGEDDEGEEDSMGGEEMYDVTDPEQLRLYNHVLQMQQQQNMHIEQHDPSGAHQLEEELGYEQMHGYGEGEDDDGEGDYGEDVDEDGLALENEYDQENDGGVMMYQQDMSRGNANM